MQSMVLKIDGAPALSPHICAQAPGIGGELLRSPARCPLLGQLAVAGRSGRTNRHEPMALRVPPPMGSGKG